MGKDDLDRSPAPGGLIFVLCRRPSAGWRRVKAEPQNVSRLAIYALIAGSLGPASRAVGSLMFGLTLNGVVYRPPILPVLIEAGVSYGLTLALGLAFALLTTLWAFPFAGVRDWPTGLAVSVFSSMPGWIGGVLFLFPPLAGLTALTTLYGVFVFYRGAQGMIQPRRGKPVAYAAVVLVCYSGLAIAMTRALRAGIASL